MIEFYEKKDLYIYYIEKDENCIEQQFFVKILSQKIHKYNHEILLINIMYKTNKYKIFLIIINMIMLLNTSYYIVFIFVSKKIYWVYKWLLDKMVLCYMRKTN